MYAWMRRFTRSFEESAAPMPYFIACFLLWISLRNAIEAFVFQIALPPLIWTHFSLAYLTLVLWLTLALASFGGRNPVGVLKLSLVGFIFVLLAPTLDWLFFEPGVDYHVTYVEVASWGELLRRYLTYFGPLEQFGITPGMRIEIAIVLVASFVYLHARTRSLARALLATWAAWTVLFIYCSTKSIWLLAGPALGLHVEESFELYIRGYVFFSGLAILGIVARGMPREFRLVLRDSRPPRALHYWLCFALGLAFADPPDPFGVAELLQLLLALAALFLMWVAAVMANNVFDLEIDRINAPERPLVTGALDPGAYLRASWWVFAAALACAAAASFEALWLVALFGLAYFVYSAPPLRLKTRCFVSKLVIGVNSAASLLVGYSLWAPTMLDVPALPFVLVLVGFSLGAHVIDLKDVEGDRAAGITNLSTLLGRTRAQQLIAGGTVLAYAALFWVFRDGWLAGVALCAGAAQVFLLTRKRYRDAPVVLVQDLVLACLAFYAWPR